MRQETEKMVEIAKEAGKIAMKYWNELKEHHISTKEDGSILTIADTEVDAYIRKELEDAFPDHSVLSEESENTKTTEGVFIIDPIDGTKNFANGDSNFGISIGFVVNGKSEIGVVYAPAENNIYIGEKGGSSYKNGEKINISKNDSLSSAKLFIHGGRTQKTVDTHEKIRSICENENPDIKIEKVKGCASLDICRVADGIYDGFIHRGLGAWDVAAGIIILESAGGVVCNLNGTEKNLFVPGIIATNNELKDKLVAITKDC